MISAEIIAIEEDFISEMITIWVCFTYNEVEIAWNIINPDKSTTTIIKNGRNVCPIYSKTHNFMYKTAEEQAKWVQLNIESEINALIKKKIPIVLELQNALVGTKYSKDSVDVTIKSDGITEEHIITVFDDGSWSVKQTGSSGTSGTSGSAGSSGTSGSAGSSGSVE